VREETKKAETRQRLRTRYVIGGSGKVVLNCAQ